MEYASTAEKAKAIATLSTLIHRGDTMLLIRRNESKNNRTTRNKIIDIRLASAPTTTTASELIGCIYDKVYIYSRGGLLMRNGESAEDVVKKLSTELFGGPNFIKAVWL